MQPITYNQQRVRLIFPCVHIGGCAAQDAGLEVGRSSTGAGSQGCGL